ncbi:MULTISPECIES: cupin domain-containing protein [unclassified Microbacterium]|uniref:cupin domain-containing protein n=1 Tax=unclassified Microbacterium TaxID=2609290 RepID=UPI00109C4E01|nr:MULTISPECIES: cupin domain-containing protein [unclassified Microbacterium]
MSGLAAGAGVDAGVLVLTHEPLPAEEVLAGAPTTAVHELATLGGVEIGVWEMAPGTATDTEADEVFVVLSGRATISFASSGVPDLEVGPGSVVRLAEGMRTTWTVTETLRKVYVA